METRDVTFNLTEEQINAIKVLLGEEICDIKKENIFPKCSNKYYFINESEVCESFWYDDELDRERLSLGNCFETREEAEFVVERLKVLHQIKQFAEPEDYEWNGDNEHYYMYWSFLANDTVKIGRCSTCKSNHIYFKSFEDAKVCIEAVGEDKIKKYYLKIED